LSQPLILTLQLDSASQTLYDDLRRRYFPPDRNFVPAHLTLFHQLPDEEDTEQIIRTAASTTSTFALSNPTPRSIGRGVAVFFEARDAEVLHAALLKAFDAHVIPQDRQRLRPHIVIQNKVDSETARQTLPLMGGISLMEPHAIGFTLWRYLGGPWERVCDIPFGDAALRQDCEP
jgi:hypothetical protein